jgi:hypothetical protein
MAALAGYSMRWGAQLTAALGPQLSWLGGAPRPLRMTVAGADVLTADANLTSHETEFGLFNNSIVWPSNCDPVVY